MRGKYGYPDFRYGEVLRGFERFRGQHKSYIDIPCPTFNVFEAAMYNMTELSECNIAS
jgi:hypothetical protein